MTVLPQTSLRCNVALAMDEMKVKEDLVYNKHTSQIVGFVNLGSTEQQLLALEQEETSAASPLATHVHLHAIGLFCFILRYIQPVCGADISVWDIIGAVESMGLKVIIVTADGASQNRKFFRMHQDPSGSNVSNGITYKTINMQCSREGGVLPQ